MYLLTTEPMRIPEMNKEKAVSAWMILTLFLAMPLFHYPMPDIDRKVKKVILDTTAVGFNNWGIIYNLTDHASGLMGATTCVASHSCRRQPMFHITIKSFTGNLTIYSSCYPVHDQTDLRQNFKENCGGEIPVDSIMFTDMISPSEFIFIDFGKPDIIRIRIILYTKECKNSDISSDNGSQYFRMYIRTIHHS